MAKTLLVQILLSLRKLKRIGYNPSDTNRPCAFEVVGEEASVCPQILYLIIIIYLSDLISQKTELSFLAWL